jgi:hypothetical protein
MASFDINFIANTTGVHTVYWRTYEDPVNTYPNFLSITVTVPGLQSVTIDVEGSLYCAPYGITYEGYIIAECQDLLPATNGIPDSVLSAGTTWTVVMAEQDDPCQDTTIECNNGSIDSISIDSFGKEYSGVNGDAGAPMTVNIAAPFAGVQATATANHGDGVLGGAIIIDDFGGEFNIANASTTQTVPLVRELQLATTGTLATVEVTFNLAARINTATIVNGGSGYTTTDNDYFTIDWSALSTPGAPTGGSGTEPKFSIAPPNQYADQIDASSFTITNVGSGYTSVPDVTFGPTAPGTIDIEETTALTDCPTLDLSEFDCGTINNVIGTPEYALSIGESITLCASPEALASLSSRFVATDNGNCHCKECNNVKINTALTGVGTGQITYQTCWDGTGAYEGAVVMVTNTINGGIATDIDLGCIIADTLYVEEINDVAPTVTITACS